MSSKLYAKTVDCGQTECVENFRFKEICKLYINTGLPGCQVPCDVRTCRTYIKENILCPIWSCYDKTTVKPWTTIAPANSTSPVCHTDPTCISSLSINGLLAILLLSALAVFLKKKRSGPRRAFIDDDVESGNTAATNADSTQTAQSTPTSQATGNMAQEGETSGRTGIENPLFSQDPLEGTSSGYSNLFIHLNKRSKPKPPVGLDANVIAESDEEKDDSK